MRNLLLAAPVEQLKSMFPQALGQEGAASETTSVLNQRAPEEIAARLKSLQGTWTIDYFASPDDEHTEKPNIIRVTGNELICDTSIVDLLCRRNYRQSMIRGSRFAIRAAVLAL